MREQRLERRQDSRKDTFSMPNRKTVSAQLIYINLPLRKRQSLKEKKKQPNRVRWHMAVVLALGRDLEGNFGKGFMNPYLKTNKQKLNKKT